MKRMLWTWAFLAVACCVDEQDRPALDIEVSVVDDEGAGLEGAKVKLENLKGGVTDAGGHYRIGTRAEDGSRIGINVQCPQGYRNTGSTDGVVKIRHLREVGSTSPSMAPVTASFTCAPKVRSHVLVIRTDGRAGLPVKITGEVASITDEDGVAQHLITGAPGDEVNVVIDTSGQPALRPAMPSRRLILPDKSRFLVFDQSFEERVKEKKRRRKKKRAAGPRRL